MLLSCKCHNCTVGPWKREDECERKMGIRWEASVTKRVNIMGQEHYYINLRCLLLTDINTKKLCCLIFLSGCDKCIWDLTDDIRLSVLTIDESKSTLLSISTGVAAQRRLNDLNATTTHLQVQIWMIFRFIM